MTITPSRDRLGPSKLAGRWLRPLNLGLSLAAGGCLSWLAAQESPQFTGIHALTNRELQLTLTAPAGASWPLTPLGALGGSLEAQLTAATSASPRAT